MIKKLSVNLCVLLLLGQLAGCTIHHSLGDHFGSYLAAPKGQDFKTVGYRWDYENTALLYVYRPATEWSMDEIETPSFNVNDERLFNIKGGGYTWYELNPGAYDVVVRRGIFGMEGIEWFEIKRIAELAFEAKAGKVYYFRYSEIDPPVIDPDLEEIPLGDGPLQLVAPSRALAELKDMQMIHRGRGLLAAREVKADEDLEEIFDATLDDAPAGDAGQSGSASGQGIKARPRTKEEEWWPF